MPDVAIFLGPSLSIEEAQTILPSFVSTPRNDADTHRHSPSVTVQYYPPVRRGEITALLSRAEVPAVIGIIDGLFLETAAVGHREILSALRQGVKVIGSSSMGALRAFELESLGMIGIGEIFHLYRSGTIESDDEVALVCDPFSYVALSEPLVHIRITLEKLMNCGLITPFEREILFKCAKQRYYPERTWSQLFEDLFSGPPPDTTVPLSPERIKELITLCQTYAVDQKRDDAISLLSYVRDMCIDNHGSGAMTDNNA